MNHPSVIDTRVLTERRTYLVAFTRWEEPEIPTGRPILSKMVHRIVVADNAKEAAQFIRNDEMIVNQREIEIAAVTPKDHVEMYLAYV